MIELFHRFPNAKLKSGLSDNSYGGHRRRRVGVTYDGKLDFYANYDYTGDYNIGSLMYPVAVRESCECKDITLEPWIPDLDSLVGLPLPV
jgi:hypothetical protein